MAICLEMKHCKVVIVGGGFSGLFAAYTLKNSRFDDFVILEAQDRIGGRIHTLKSNGKYLDMGAQFIHGKDGNPLYEFCRSKKVNTFIVK